MTSGPPLLLKELMIREILQFLCALKVDSCGDNAKTINLSVTNSHKQSITEQTENDRVNENTPHMTFHEMTHEDRVLLYRILPTTLSH